MAQWSIAEAKSKLSEVIDRARAEPQTISRRGRPVAVVVNAESYDRLVGEAALAQKIRKAGLKGFLDKAAELRRRAEGRDLGLKLPARKVDALRSPFGED